MLGLPMDLLGAATLRLPHGAPDWVARDMAGLPALLMLDAANNRGWFDGAVFASESATLAAVNGVANGITRTIGDYVAADAPELLANGDLSAGLGDWTAVNGATAAVNAGALEMSGSGLTNPSIRSGAIPTVQGKAYRMKATYRRGTSSSSPLVVSSRATSLSPVGNSLPANATTANITQQRIFAAEATASYIALRTASGPNGTVIGDDFSVKEAAAFRGFSAPEFTALLRFRMPASLPAATRVLFSFDDGGARNRYRIGLNTDGTLSIVLDSNGVNRITLTIPAALVTLTSEHRLHLSSNGATRFLAALDGTNLFGSQVGSMVPAGAAWLRLGTSPAGGEDWTGQILDAAFFNREVVPGWFVWAVGDSYVASIGGASVEQGVEASSSRQVLATGISGSAIAAQLAAMQPNPGLAGCPLVHWDGDANGVSVEEDKAIFEAMATFCPRHVFVGATRRANNAALAGAVDQRNGWLASRFGARYLDPHPALAALSDGSSGDLAALAANRVPPSCLQGDGVHLTPAAMAAVGGAIAAKLTALGF